MKTYAARFTAGGGFEWVEPDFKWWEFRRKRCFAEFLDAVKLTAKVVELDKSEGVG